MSSFGKKNLGGHTFWVEFHFWPYMVPAGRQRTLYTQVKSQAQKYFKVFSRRPEARYKQILKMYLEVHEGMGKGKKPCEAFSRQYDFHY